MSLDIRGAIESIPPRTMVADEVYSRLRTLIMEGTIPPGKKLNIEDFARELDVSATPVRESLARLEADELVLKLPQRGYRTTELLNREQVRELYELRLLLEPNAAASAARHVSPDAARVLADEMESCAPGPEGEYRSYQELSSHDVRLHDKVLAIAGNETIRQAYARTHCHLHVFRLAFAGTFGAHTIKEHSLIVEAISQGNPSAASDAMQHHVEASRNRILERFDELA